MSGHAVDLVPYINGKLRWEREPIYQIADAVRTAAQELDIPIRCGGAWDMLLTSNDDPTEDIVIDYVARRKKAFIDGPHFELTRSLYPDNA